MDLRQLNYFVKIAQFGSFSRAAEQLHVAQPALSRHVRLLEAEIGLTLLNRHGRGAIPTMAGTLLLKHATQILGALEEARQELANLADRPIGTIRLGVPPAIGECLTVELLDEFKKRYPQISLQIAERWTGYIRELLFEKKLDFGVLSSTQLNRKFHHVTLVKEPVHLVSAKHSARSGPIHIQDLGEIPLVLAPRPHGSRLIVENALRRYGIKANIVLESEVWSVIKDVVQKGIACTLVPRREVINELARGMLRSQPLQKPGMTHVIALSRLANVRREPFEDEAFDFLASHIQHALVTRGRRTGDAP